MESRQEQLRARLRALGFDDVRFASLAALETGGLRAWLDAGMHGDMQWMERTADKRLNPGLVLPGARSAIMLGISYWSEALRPRASTNPAWARYALYEDYHDTLKPALVAGGRVLEELYGAAESDYRYYVDAGPVLERGWAARAGLGFIGKNAMLISRRDGNWLFLASILTRVELAADAPVRKKLGLTHSRDYARDHADKNAPAPARAAASASAATSASLASTSEPAPAPVREVGLLCGKCTRCLDACPTDAFPEPGTVDARRCVSYQTIENKGVIPRELRTGIGHRVYGCDTCLEVCPWNRFAQEGRKMLLVARHDLADLTLPQLLELTPESFAAIFRRTPIKRVKLGGLLRNACIVAGNSGDQTLLPALVRLASSHALPLVRAHAVWAVYQLAGDAAAELLQAARAAETEAMVLAEYPQAPL